MTVRSRSWLAGAVLAATLAVPFTAAGPASADLVPLPPVPVDTTCPSTAPTDLLQCEVSSAQGTVTTITSQTILTTGTGTAGTGATSTGSVPTASGGTVQQGSTGPRASTKTKRHYRLHRARHRHRG